MDIEHFCRRRDRLTRLNPRKLHVEFLPGVSPEGPVIDRHYTLTSSDSTGELYLTVGTDFAYDMIDSKREEVLVKWRFINNRYVLYATCFVGGSMGLTVAALRYNIFKKELPFAFQTLRYGDRIFFETHEALDQSPIWVHFDSSYPYYNRIKVMGKPEDYR